MTDDVRGLIAALGLGVCDLVGYSMGGRVVLNLAANHPREVRRLVLAATSARVNTDPQVLHALGHPGGSGSNPDSPVVGPPAKESISGPASGLVGL